MITLYNVISADGFIARKDGSEDFIPEEVWKYDIAFFKQYDSWVMGRKTYEAIQAYDKESRDLLDHAGIHKIVLTHDRNFRTQKGFEIVHSLKSAFETGENILISSGPTVNSAVLEDRSADKIVQYRLSEAIGEGIEPFAIDTGNILKKIREEKAAFGTIITYNVIKKS